MIPSFTTEKADQFADMALNASYHRAHVFNRFPEDERNLVSAEALKKFSDWLRENPDHPSVMPILTPLACAIDSTDESVLVSFEYALFKFRFHDEGETFSGFCESLYEILRDDINYWLGKEMV